MFEEFLAGLAGAKRAAARPQDLRGGLMAEPVPTEWRADFRAAEEHSLEASLAATPSQRLAWLEQALAFAYRVGALSSDEEKAASRPPSRD
jgi:hypothetical protein